MSPELVMYYRGESLKTIAEASGTKTKTISNRLRKERIRLGYKNRPNVRRGLVLVSLNS